MPQPNARDTQLHDRWLAQQLEDPEFRAAYERERLDLDAVSADEHADDHPRTDPARPRSSPGRDIASRRDDRAP
jgi:hypothetical protein